VHRLQLYKGSGDYSVVAQFLCNIRVSILQLALDCLGAAIAGETAPS
jgi:hypothetical protein